MDTSWIRWKTVALFLKFIVEQRIYDSNDRDGTVPMLTRPKAWECERCNKGEDSKQYNWFRNVDNS